jgi:hypothetical protein
MAIYIVSGVIVAYTFAMFFVNVRFALLLCSIFGFCTKICLSGL